MDPIPTNFLKEVSPLSNCVILTIINQSLFVGSVPQSFKIDIIKPLIKKPNLDTSVPSNYRPVSNLLFLWKLSERIVARQFSDF